MSHSHHPGSNGGVSRKLAIATAATLLLVAAELATGLHAGSLSLIGDAFHNFTDALALGLALVAVRLERRPATEEKSFGYRRAGVLAAFINAGTLVALTVFLVAEAVGRLRTPQVVESGAMLVVAPIALALNVAISVALHHEGKHDVNIRGAVLHMLGDAVSSIGIIVAALLIRLTGSPRWDALVSLLIAALILWSSWGILRETINLLLEGTPAGIDPAVVSDALAAMDGVQGVHHLHIWALGPSSPALSCHLMVDDVPVRRTASMLEQINLMLLDEFRIAHTTVQFEFAQCADDDVNCIPFSTGGGEKTSLPAARPPDPEVR